MASSRQAVPLLLLLAAVAALVGSATAGAELTALHARMAAEWAWSAASSSDDDSCWGSPEECPVVHDVGAEGAGAGAAARARMRLQQAYYYDVNTAATLLPTAQYISYGALMRDSVPCSIPGASYYNCQPGAEANPYTRGCSEITQCRG
ncbi:hypothetical protein SETIT_9G407300v2 [Setaria italica]|uniref:Rapid ALkalinization Factor family protein n=1 Tax=Setaria italica TaxID=4555 RepID=K4AKR2_SETIT|nr:rapid alkalinization factor [Setaria italica]RCV44844.1 hypothetical protein SETIT_9G407300v2 [Setaria italica]